jgi:predicted DNA-binding transcriptional regulator AlpA
MDESFTVDEWCRYRKLSRSMFYMLQKRGMGPKTHKVGRLTRISKASDTAWLAEREAASLAEVA